MAYDAYNATLKYIEESGLLENHTFEEAYDIVVYLTDILSGIIWRYVSERDLWGIHYKNGYDIWEHPNADKTACGKLIPDGGKLYPMLKIAYEMRDSILDYRFNDGWWLPIGLQDIKINKLKRFNRRLWI